LGACPIREREKRGPVAPWKCGGNVGPRQKNLEGWVRKTCDATQRHSRCPKNGAPWKGSDPRKCLLQEIKGGAGKSRLKEKKRSEKTKLRQNTGKSGIWILGVGGNRGRGGMAAF